MGERKGQNFYYPPDFNYKVHKSLNRYHGTHALRERASRIHEGILRIRFEMPFNIWCLGCKNHVAMGVRFNANKTKVGMYYTTPLFEFRMKCHLCTNYFTIRTDPKNFDYELVEGCRRQENRFDPSTVDNLAPVDRTFNLKVSADAMFKAEHTVDDKKSASTVDDQIQRLEQIQSRLFDDYGANSFMRNAFRREKKELNERRAKDVDLKTRLSTGINLLPEQNEDRIAAERMLKYRNLNGSDVDKEKSNVLSTSIFSPKTPTAAEKNKNNNGNSAKKILFDRIKQKSGGLGFAPSLLIQNGNEAMRRAKSIQGVRIKPKVEKREETDIDCIEIFEETGKELLQPKPENSKE